MQQVIKLVCLATSLNNAAKILRLRFCKKRIPKNMRVLLVACMLLLLQQIKSQSLSFPQSFVGNWKGVLQLYKAGKDTVQSVAMELRVQAIGTTPGQYTWNLIYGKPTEDNRPYLLKPVNITKGHWIIDELNGITPATTAEQLLNGAEFRFIDVAGERAVLNRELQAIHDAHDARDAHDALGRRAPLRDGGVSKNSINGEFAGSTKYVFFVSEFRNSSIDFQN